MQINRSHLFRRAWQLARWNRRYATAPLEFSRWLTFAWAELKAGKVRTWSFEPIGEIGELRAVVVALESRDRLGVDGVARLCAAYGRLARLAA
jgi:hypothetical protein